jgi:hypothetical protein
MNTKNKDKEGLKIKVWSLGKLQVLGEVPRKMATTKSTITPKIQEHQKHNKH